MCKSERETTLCYIKQESCDAAAVRCGLKFADNPMFTTSLRVANLQKPGFRAIEIPTQNKI